MTSHSEHSNEDQLSYLSYLSCLAELACRSSMLLSGLFTCSMVPRHRFARSATAMSTPCFTDWAKSLLCAGRCFGHG